MAGFFFNRKDFQLERIRNLSDKFLKFAQMFPQLGNHEFMALAIFNSWNLQLCLSVVTWETFVWALKLRWITQIFLLPAWVEIYATWRFKFQYNMQVSSLKSGECYFMSIIRDVKTYHSRYTISWGALESSTFLPDRFWQSQGCFPSAEVNKTSCIQVLLIGSEGRSTAEFLIKNSLLNREWCPDRVRKYTFFIQSYIDQLK